MFTGLIEEVGIIKIIKSVGGSRIFTIDANKIFDDLKIDDSVSLNGACQTVTEVKAQTFTVQAVEETLKKTTLINWNIGKKLNLERALTLNTRLGGHLVQGHVDCTGKVNSIIPRSSSFILDISFPIEYAHYTVDAGSICINGVSLTIVTVRNNVLTLSIIPHTWKNTTLAELKVGDLVNIEFDLIAKYIDKIINTNKNIETKDIWEGLLDQPY